MTEEDIVRLAEEAELWLHTDRKYEAVEKFAKLVAAEERNRTWTQDHWTEYERSIAAAEREWCAKFLLSTDLSGLKGNIELQNFTATLLLNYATAIRARGQG